MTQDEVVSLLERKGYREVHHFMDGDDVVYVMEKRRGPSRLMGQVEADGTVSGMDVNEFLRSQQASCLSCDLVKIAKELTSDLTDIPQTLQEKRKAIRNLSFRRNLDLVGWMSDHEIESVIRRIPEDAFQREYQKVKSLTHSLF